MVQHLHAEELAGINDLARHRYVFGGGGGVAGGVVVRDDDCGGVLLQRLSAESL